MYLVVYPDSGLGARGFHMNSTEYVISSKTNLSIFHFFLHFCYVTRNNMSKYILKKVNLDWSEFYKA